MASKWLEDLKSGINFRVIQGKHVGSKLVIIGDNAYVSDQAPRDGASSSSGIFYLKCKFHRSEQCKVRGKIVDNFATIFNMDTVQHTCTGQSSPHRWRAQEALTRMKERAASESSSLDVSICMWIEVVYLFVFW